MNNTDILWPMVALAMWTFIVLLQMPIRRFAAASKHQVVPGDFKLGESGNVPQWVVIANRNYMNLLELPVLFYVVCLALYVTDHVAAFSVYLAWIFVVLRVLHSLVHLTYNNVFHRLAMFASSNFVLVGVWVWLIIALLHEPAV